MRRLQRSCLATVVVRRRCVLFVAPVAAAAAAAADAGLSTVHVCGHQHAWPVMRDDHGPPANCTANAPRPSSQRRSLRTARRRRREREREGMH